MNVLVTTPNESAVLDIIDCTEHMEVGGKKDARYIASIFEANIEELDPKGVHLNAVLFDGASNVQKAVVTKAVDFIKDKAMWKALYCVLRCLFPALRVLRLADRSEPGFNSFYPTSFGGPI